MSHFSHSPAHFFTLLGTPQNHTVDDLFISHLFRIYLKLISHFIDMLLPPPPRPSPGRARAQAELRPGWARARAQAQAQPQPNQAQPTPAQPSILGRRMGILLCLTRKELPREEHLLNPKDYDLLAPDYGGEVV